jgi:hypothetical protein
MGHGHQSRRRLHDRAHIVTGLWQEMRPYLALWHPLMRLARGTWTLARRAGSACLDGTGSDKLWRLLGLIVAVGITARIADRAPMVMLPLTLV